MMLKDMTIVDQDLLDQCDIVSIENTLEQIKEPTRRAELKALYDFDYPVNRQEQYEFWDN